MAAESNRSLRLGSVRQGATQSAPIQERVTALYEAHRDQMFRFLVGQGVPPSAAQEATQDVFVDLFIALEKGTKVESELGWLYTVAGRAAVDYWRRERRSVRVEFEPENANFPSLEPSPEAQVGESQRLRRVAEGMTRLPKEQRLCVQLRMQGLRYREIAKILGVSTSTAADWLVTAVNRLRGEPQ